MVISKTPFRMSFFGGGTDYPEFYKEHGGSVLSTTFDKYCYVTVRHLPPFFEYEDRITYSKIENVHSVDEIQHPSIRETMRYLDMKRLHVSYDGDLPARAGLGSSSSFVVGMLNSFYALKGKYADKKHLADEAIHIERVLCREDGGVQDQIAVAYGGLNRIDFSEGGYIVKPLTISSERKKEFSDNLLLFFTGFSRISAEIAKSQKRVIESKRKELDLVIMASMVDEACHVLQNRNENIDRIGSLLDEAWNIKRGLTDKISTDTIDDIYKEAKRAGAVGGKLLGAGGGGFILFYVKKKDQKKVVDRLRNLIHVPFDFESDGSQIIYYVEEEFES